MTNLLPDNFKPYSIRAQNPFKSFQVYVDLS